MKKSKIKKILFISVSIIVLATISFFLYRLVYSSFYKLECSRNNDGVLETYNFEFDILKQIKKITKRASFPFSSEENARFEYENHVVDKSVAELNGKNIIYTIGDVEITYKTLDETKVKYTNFMYDCRMVKK